MIAALFRVVVDIVTKVLGRRGELRVARNRVVRRLRGMRTAEGKVWDDEKWHLGPELDRLAEAIAQAGAGPDWTRAEQRARERVLLGGERGAIDDSIRELEALS